jgi:hypothetical protein
LVLAAFCLTRFCGCKVTTFLIIILICFER